MGQWQIKWIALGEVNVLIDADESCGASLAYCDEIFYLIWNCLVLTCGLD